MIHSLFMINPTGDIFCEKHWKSVISRSVCDYFFDAQSKSPGDGASVPPVIHTPHHFLISIHRCNIHLVSVAMSEVPPLFVVEFLHRVIDTLTDYFGDCSESIIKDNLVVVYELLDEMLDNGYPLGKKLTVLISRQKS